MEQQILHFISIYGIPVFVIASCCIAFIGILKALKLFTKIKNANIRKLVYYILNVGLSFGATAIYFAYSKISFDGYIVFSCTQITATTTLYAIYENFGFRKIVKLLLNWIASWFVKNPEHKFVKAMKQLGLNENSIQYLQSLVNLEVDKQKKATEVASK